MGDVEVQVPKVRDKSQQGIKLNKQLIPPYLKRTESIEELLPVLYLKGLSTGEFSEALKSLLGKELLEGLRHRGLIMAPKLAIGDGALGFWKALSKVYPQTRHQRCWVFRGIIINGHSTLLSGVFYPKSVSIRRHIKIRSDAIPFELRFNEYF